MRLSHDTVEGQAFRSGRFGWGPLVLIIWVGGFEEVIKKVAVGFLTVNDTNYGG